MQFNTITYAHDSGRHMVAMATIINDSAIYSEDLQVIYLNILELLKTIYYYS